MRPANAFAAVAILLALSSFAAAGCHTMSAAPRGPEVRAVDPDDVLVGEIEGYGRAGAADLRRALVAFAADQGIEAEIGNGAEGEARYWVALERMNRLLHPALDKIAERLNLDLIFRSDVRNGGCLRGGAYAVESYDVTEELIRELTLLAEVPRL